MTATHQDPPKLIMQARCVWCDVEHHAQAVHAISLGEYPCSHCGRYSTSMNHAQLTAIRFITTGQGSGPYPCTTCEEKFGTLGFLIGHLRTRHPIADA